LEDVDWINLA